MRRIFLAAAVSMAATMAGARITAADTVQISSLQVANIQQDTGRPAVDKSAGGAALTLGGKKFEKGLGLQAPAKIILNLKGGSDRFTATVGVDDEVKGQPGGTASFTIMGDSRPLWPPAPAPVAGARGRGRGRGFTAPPIAAGDAPQKIDIDVKGIRVLVIQIGPGVDGVMNDHADLADAKLDFSGARPEIAPVPVDQPVVLTPKDPPSPRINGAKIFGVRPGHPVLFTIAATGDRPMVFSAEGLPAGVKLDATTGFLTGSTTEKGEHVIKVHARNALGTADSTLRLEVGDTINLTPQLGWNSWNCFGSRVTADKVKQAADAMVSSGLINHGWSYINVDDFWEKNANQARNDPTMAGPARAEDGTILPNARFPDMKALADYVHGKGMKIGLYSSPGLTTCGGCTASLGHEEQDAMSWAKWGFDYIKYDVCSYRNNINQQRQAAVAANGGPLAPEALAKLNRELAMKPYIVLRDALAKVDRDMVYSLCQYGDESVWEWGAEVGGNSWRTTGDIGATWQSVTQLWDRQVGKEKYAGPGHWNDPDMLVVGNVDIGSGANLRPTGLSANEQLTHISVWILLDAPMLIGCDMTKMDAFTLGLLSNDEILAVSQDPLGKQASRVWKEGDWEIWEKDMEDGSKAAGIFNRSEIDAHVPAKWADLKISGKQSVRDLWRQKDLGTFDGTFETVVPRHGAVMVKISPVK